MIGESEAYHRNVKEQYEALGRFVGAFEMMVDQVRSTCILLMGPNPFDKRLPIIAFHHGAMTAKPLFDIMRAMIAQLAKQDDLLDADEKPIFAGVLAQIAKDYSDLVSMRNNLLHGTWFVGSISVNDSEAATFRVRKQTSTKDGLGLLELPTTTKELDALKNRCEEVRLLVEPIRDCIPLVGDGSSIERRFTFDGKKWLLKPYWKLPPSQQKRTARRP
jgi:hypothetical protein